MEYKNEYKERARELMNDIIRVPIKECESSHVYNDIKRIVRYSMIRVNFNEYISVSSFFINWKMLVRNGILKEKDFLIVRGGRGQVRCYMSLREARYKKDEIMATIKYQSDKEAFSACMDSAGLNIVENSIVSDEDLLKSEEAYRERLLMLKKSKEYNREYKYKAEEEELREVERMRTEAEKNEEASLREMVRRIEAMGWIVTLRLKDNGTDY